MNTSIFFKVCAAALTVWCLCLLSVCEISSAERFCNRTFNSNFTTRCTACVRNKDVECPYGATKLSTGKGVADCIYIVTLGGSKIVPLAGCHHLCHRTAVQVRCCDGHWGPQCEECPGGPDNVCNGHGLCSSGIDGIGTCDCDENYTGTACEICSNNTFYGQNCSQECQCMNGTCNSGVNGDGSCDCYSGYTGDLCDIEIEACKNLTCDSNSRCQEFEIAGNITGNITCISTNDSDCDNVTRNVTCVCDHGFLDNGANSCIPIDNCESSPCHVYADCLSTGPAQHECQCSEGYTGDGIYCEPINPCQLDNGGCNVLSSVCVYMGPNKSVCDCMAGYENYQEGVGCDLIDICSTESCHKNASCTTVDPYSIDCQCDDGFVGDGQECYGNILQRLEDLNANDDTLNNQLTFAMAMLKAGYKDVLTENGPFTIFVPVSQGFKSIFKETDFEKFLSDRDRVRQIIRQHTIVGQHSLEDLQQHTDYYTLQGVPLTLNMRVRSEVFKYRLRGQSDKAKILRGNLVCANGMVHITNSLITMEPEVVGNPKKTILTVMREEGRYRRFVSHIERLNMQSMFETYDTTVFAPSNRVFDDLPEGTVEYLTSTDGLPLLKKIVFNHVFNGLEYAETLINKKRILSLALSAVSVTIRDNGQIQLNKNVNITQTDIQCSNGVYHHVEGLLVPADMGDILPKRCDVQSYKIVRGSCDVCNGKLNCPLPTDLELKTVISGCRYWVNIEGQYIAYVGCARMCNRTYVRKRCCDGFYGDDCLSCPGGFQNPCGGHGTCFDSRHGNGSCSCDNNFSGQKCQNCAGMGMFGPNCTQDCTCLNGECDDGPQGSGLCKENSCFEGFVGDNCDRRLLKCGAYNQLCHTYSQCYEDGETFRCLCKPGYEGDGLHCREIDPCLKPDRGGCHSQAKCTKVGPDMPRCECDNGWVGDGFSCQPANPCYHHSECGQHAQCRTFTLEEYHCVCDEGYFGNGTVCEASDSCLSDHGGCHPKAFCISSGPGINNCSCMQNYGGDGIDCYSTIAQEVIDNPKLTRLAALFGKLAPDDNILMQTSENFTFFAPSDDAMANFTEQAPGGYFNDSENILSLIGFHTLENTRTTYDLLQLSKVYSKFDTLYDGYSIRIVNKSNTVLIYTSQKSSSLVVSGNIPALNGFIHIVDQVLEPIIPDADQPDLEEFFSQNSDYSMFFTYLQKYGLVEYLEDEVDQYTLFALSNSAMIQKKDTVTTRFLKYYIVPRLLLTPTLTDGQQEVTSLGRGFPVVFGVRDEQVFVDGVLIQDLDRLTMGGVVQGISDLLHPQLSRCDDTQSNRTRGPCIPCDSKSYTCPKGYSPVSGVGLIRNQCTYSATDVNGKTYNYMGCYGMCVSSLATPACCSGYFGKNCEECPGGPENPCVGNGVCMDGMTGSGECQCFPQFRGDDCSQCIDNLAGPACNLSVNSCEYMNGNCSENAACNQTDNGVTCRCNDGYIGDGHICYSPCANNNGGCHEQATCVYNYETINCTCYSGYHGNGSICYPTKNKCAVDSGGCSPFAHCVFTPPEVTELHNGTVECDCLQGFVGNGTLCNRDIYDTLSYLYLALRFHEVLEYNRKIDENITDLLGDRFQSITLFVPVDNSIEDISLLTLEDISNHVVNSTQLYLNSSTQLPLTLVSLAGQPLVITSNGSEVEVNGIRIVDANIPTLNGYIHMIEKPLWATHDGKPPRTENTSGNTQKSGPNIGLIIGLVLLAVVIIGLIVVAIVAYRRSKTTGFMDIWRGFRKGSDSTSFARLQANQDDNDSRVFKHPDNINFSNPLYNSREDS